MKHPPKFTPASDDIDKEAFFLSRELPLVANRLEGYCTIQSAYDANYIRRAMTLIERLNHAEG